MVAERRGCQKSVFGCHAYSVQSRSVRPTTAIPFFSFGFFYILSLLLLLFDFFSYSSLADVRYYVILTAGYYILRRARARPQRPSRIHYLVKEENGLSINVNALGSPRRETEQKKKKKRLYAETCRRIILDYFIYIYIHTSTTYNIIYLRFIIIIRVRTGRPPRLAPGRSEGNATDQSGAAVKTWVDTCCLFFLFRQIPREDCRGFSSVTWRIFA